METETLPEMTIEIPGVFDSLNTGADPNVQEINLGTVWNEWNNNWSSVDIAGTEVNENRIDRRPQWPFIRRVNRTTVDFECFSRQSLFFGKLEKKGSIFGGLTIFF